MNFGDPFALDDETFKKELDRLMATLQPPISPPAALPTTKDTTEQDARSAAVLPPFVNSFTGDGS